MLKKLKAQLEALQTKQQEAFDKMIETSNDASIAAYEASIRACNVIEEQISALEKKALNTAGVPGGANNDNQDLGNMTEGQKFFRKMAEAVAIGSTYTGLVPNEIQDAVQKKIEKYGIFRKYCTVHKTTGTYTLTVEGTGVTTAYVAEAGVISDSTPTAAVVQLGAYKLAALVKVSKEMISDVALNFQEYIIELIAKSMAKFEDYEIIFGTGSSNSHMTGAQVTATADTDADVATSTASTLAWTDVVALVNALGEYAKSPNCVLVMNPAIANAIKVMTDDSHYIFPPNEPLKEILGVKVETYSEMPVKADSAKIILGGDFSFYHIADRQEIEITTLNELYAANDQIGIKAVKRIDGKLALSSAFKYLLVTPTT
jgi:HK97 family phage major capsid protein